MPDLAEGLMTAEIIERLKTLDERLVTVKKELDQRFQRLEDLMEEVDGRLVDLDLPYR